MEVGSLPNHVNSCVLCVCLLFNLCLFTVIDLSPGVLFAQQKWYFATMLKHNNNSVFYMGKINYIYSNNKEIHNLCILHRQDN